MNHLRKRLAEGIAAELDRSITENEEPGKPAQPSSRTFYYYRPDAQETIEDAVAFESDNGGDDELDHELLAWDAAEHFYDHGEREDRMPRHWPIRFVILRADYSRVGVFKIELDHAPVFHAEREE